MKTAFILMAQYDAIAVIPLHKIVKDYFPHLSPEMFVRKVALGDISIPVIGIDPSTRKTAKGVHILDMANYIDACRESAIREMQTPVP